MEELIREIGAFIKCKGKAFSSGLEAGRIKASILMIKSKVTEFLFGQLGKNTSDTGSKGNNKEEELCLLQVGDLGLANGMKAKD